MAEDSAAEESDKQRTYSVFLVGFPSLVRALDQDNLDTPVAELISHVVLEAHVHRHDIFGGKCDTTVRLESTSTDDEAESADNREARESEIQTLLSGVDDDAGCSLSPSPEDGDKPEKAGSDDHIDIPAGLTPKHARFNDDSVSVAGVTTNLFSHAWIEMNAISLLENIQSKTLEEKNARPGQVILSGYGFGGIVVKRAVIIANTTPKYYEVAVRVSRLVFFATPHRLTNHLSGVEVLLDMIKATNLGYRSQPSRILLELVDSVSQLSHDFYKFVSKYLITNFIDGKGCSTVEPVIGELGKFNISFEKAFPWHDKDFHTIMFCASNDLRRLESLQDQFSPARLSDQEYFKGLDDTSQAAMSDSYFSLLQALSPSRWILHEAKSLERSLDLSDTKAVFRSLLDNMRWNDIRAKKSIQVTGPEGYGKSAFVKLVSQEFSQRFSTIVIENFPASDTRCPPTPYDLSVSFLHQVLSQRPSLFGSVQNLMAELLPRKTWTTENLQALLKLIAHHSRDVHFLIIIYDYEKWQVDAQSWWSTTLSKLLRTCGASYTFLASSKYLAPEMNPLGTGWEEISLQSGYEQAREDFINMKTKGFMNDGFGPITLTPELAGNLRKEIVSKANSFQGSFTALRALLALLSRRVLLNTPGAQSREVEGFPKTEEELYSQELQLLRKKPLGVLSWALSVMSWLLSSLRPLRIDELATAAVIDLNNSDVTKLREMVSMDMERDTQSQIGPLVAVENRYARISNASARRILTNDGKIRQLLNLQDDARLAELCIHYIRIILKDCKPQMWKNCLSQVSWKRQRQALPDPALGFLDYACRFWPTHFSAAKEASNSLSDVVIDFLLDPEVAGRWFRLYLLCTSDPLDDGEETPWSASSSQRFKAISPVREEAKFCSSDDAAHQSAVFIASYVGLASLIPEILSKSKDIELKTAEVRRGFCKRNASYTDTQSSDYLDCAISNDDASVVKALLEADPKRRTSFPLHEAALAGSIKTAKMLLALLEEPFEADEQRRTPLHMAAISGHTEMISMLLGAVTESAELHVADLINAVDKNFQTPLILAACTGDIEAVKLLTRPETNLSIKDHNGRTALHHAVLNCAMAFKVLADQNSEQLVVGDDQGLTVLHLAAISSNMDTAESLLHALGSRALKAINAEDIHGKTPLHYAAENGFTHLCELFTKNAGASMLNQVSTSLELAATHGNLATVKLIASACGDKMPGNILGIACESGQLVVVMYLLKELCVSPDDQELDPIPLFAAVTNDHSAVVRALLQHNADVNIEDRNRHTPLHHAARRGRYSIARMLLDNGANVDAPDIERYTPLHEASKAGWVRIIELLIEHEADIEACSRTNETPLHVAVRHPEAVKVLLQKHADPRAVDFLDQTPLHMATKDQCFKSVQYLIKYKGLVDAVDDDGTTPLKYAIRHNNLPMVRGLYKGEVDPETDGEERLRQALVWAVEASCESSDLSILRFLLKKPEGPGAVNKRTFRKNAVIHTVAELDSPSSPEILGLLIDNGADIDLQSRQQRTPLHYATRALILKNMEELLKRNASVDKVDEYGDTSLYIAVNKSSLEAVKILLRYNANVNEQGNSPNRTPLFRAAYSGFVEGVRILLEHSADVGLVDLDGWSPLHAAADHLEITEMLLQHGADSNLEKNDGWTPLHLAVHWEQISVAETLLLHQSDPNKANRSGETPFHLAVSYGEGKMLQLLLKWKADPDIKSEDGLSCLSLAVDGDRGENFDLLLKVLLPSEPVSSASEMLSLYWRVVEKRAEKCLQALVNMARYLLDEESSEGFTALETCLRNRNNNNVEENFAICLVKEGASPFARRHPNRKSGFELGVISRRTPKMSFINVCLESVDDCLGFQELRIVTELNKSEFWERSSVQKALKSLRSHDSPITDQDGWNIEHFIYQAAGRVPIEAQETVLAKSTKTPTGMLIPPLWAAPDSVEIAQAGTEIKFASKLKRCGLRADFPFPPRDRGPSHFEIKILKADERFTTSDFPRDNDDNSDDDDDNHDNECGEVIIAIGFCGEFCELFEAHTGWNAWSVGYHGDDGGLFDEYPHSHIDTDREFGVGDVVGCGIDYTASEYYFTLGGEVVARSRFYNKGDVIFRKLYPTISHKGAACKVEVNFGEKEFVWEGARRRREEDVPRRMQRKGTWQDRWT